MDPEKSAAYITQRIFLCCLLLLVGCHRNSPETTASHLAAELRMRILTESGSATTPTAPQRIGNSLFSEWEMRCRENPEQLKQLLTSRLSTDFTVALDTPELVVFSKYDGHDVVRIEVHYPNSSEQAQVRLTLAPD